MDEQTHALYPLEPWEYRAGTWQRRARWVPVERPLTVYVNGREVATLMASPHDPLVLAVGFIANEGWLAHRRELAATWVCRGGDCVDLWLHHSIPQEVRRVFTSGCSGGQTFHLPEQVQGEPLPPGPRVDVRQLFAWFREMRERARLYLQGQGVHAAGLVVQGRLALVEEDIGRHNAVDRVRGRALLQDLDTRGGVLITTGRISAEMALKAVRMGCPVVASRTAATSLALQVARHWGLTLVTYVRPPRCRVYHGRERLVMQAQGHPEASWP